MGYFEDLEREIARDLGREEHLRQKKAAGGCLARWFGKSSRLGQFLRRGGRGLRKILFFPIISPLGYAKRFDMHGDMVVLRRATLWRIADALMTRALLAPLFLTAFLLAVVYANTHPPRVEAVGTPLGLGMFYDRVTLQTVDNQRVAGWYIPAVTADEVAFDPNEALAQRRPGVVLCHGLGASHDQYLPLAKELHQAGFVVLMLDCRGQGDSAGGVVTYGLRERTDVLAGVKFLRELSSVDDAKVCVVGHDIGAQAALEAAGLDSTVAAVVADGLWPRFEERARDIFAQPLGKVPTQWLAPLYTTAFEIALGERWQFWEPETVVRSIHRQPVLFISQPGSQYAPLSEVVHLAAESGGKHEVIVADRKTAAEVDDGIRQFLVDSTGWRGTSAKGVEEIQRLLKNRVK